MKKTKNYLEMYNLLHTVADTFKLTLVRISSGNTEWGEVVTSYSLKNVTYLSVDQGALCKEILEATVQAILNTFQEMGIESSAEISQVSYDSFTLYTVLNEIEEIEDNGNSEQTYH